MSMLRSIFCCFSSNNLQAKPVFLLAASSNCESTLFKQQYIWLFSQRQYDVARDFADYVERNLNEASEVEKDQRRISKENSS